MRSEQLDTAIKRTFRVIGQAREAIEPRLTPREVGTVSHVAAGIAMWLGVKRDDLVKIGGEKADPDDPNAGAVV